MQRQLADSFTERFKPGPDTRRAQNLWRMRQSFETYREEEFLAPPVRELSWSGRSVELARGEA